MDLLIRDAIEEAEQHLIELDVPEDPTTAALPDSISHRFAHRIFPDVEATERQVPRLSMADDSPRGRLVPGMEREILRTARDLEAAEALRSLASMESRNNIRPVDLILPASVSGPGAQVPMWEQWREDYQD